MEYPRPPSTQAALEQWLDIAPWPMHFVDQRAVPLAVNPALTALLGFEAQEMTRQQLRQCMPTRTRRRLREAIEELSQRDQPEPFVELPLIYLHRDGSELCAQRARVSLQSPGQATFLVMLAGVEAAEGLNRAELQARLCRLVTHDLNNGFTVAQSFVDLTRRQRPRYEQARDYLDRAARALRRSIEISRMLAIITVDHPLPYEEVALAEEATALRAFIPRLFSPGPQWSIHCENDLPLVMSHPIYIRRLLLDLSINARLRWPHSGELSMEIRTSRGEENTILIRVTPSATASPAHMIPFRLFFTRADPFTQVIEDPLFIRGILRHHRVPIDAADDGITAILSTD